MAKATTFVKDNKDSSTVTFFNHRGFEQDERGVLVFIDNGERLHIEDVDRVAASVEYSEDSLIDSIREHLNYGSVHFYLDRRKQHRDLIKAFTEEEGIFESGEGEKFYLYIKEDLASNSFAGVPVSNITIL